MSRPSLWSSLRLGHMVFLSVVTAIGLAVSVFIWWAEVQREEAAIQSGFDRNADQIHAALTARMETFEAVLRAGAAYWAEHPSMDANPWRTFVERALLSAGYAGIDGMAAAFAVDPANKDAFVADIRKRLWRDFTIMPPDISGPAIVITHFEPAANRDQVLGFNIAADPIRLQTALTARDSGTAALSPRLTLATNNKDGARDFILFQPIYRPDHPLATVEQRRQALSGWLLLGIHAHELIAALAKTVPDPLFDFQIYSGSVAEPNRIYDGRSPDRHTENTSNVQRIVDFAGSRWIISAQRRLPRSAIWFGQTPLALLAACVGFSLTLTAAALLLIVSREQSRRLARQAMGQLSRTERRLAAVTASVPGTVFRWMQRPDGTGGFTFISPQSTMMCGIAPEELVADWRRLPFAPDDLERWPQAMAAAAAGTGEWQMEGRYFALDKGLRWWKGSARAYPAEDGAIAVNGLFVDISEQKDAQALLADKSAKLEAINAELEQFSYVASHDLQEPLRTIAGFLQLIERRYQDKVDAEGREFIAFAVEAAVRLQAMIQDLLDYSRIGTRGAGFAVTDLNTTAAEACANLGRSISEARAHVYTGELPKVLADKTQMVSLFQNLLGNALKYHRPDIAPIIDISAEDAGADWTICVQDNGIGIDPEYFDRIFLVFQRLHTRDKFSGTGIGLALCRKIARRHGGDIAVTSTPGQGACFHITLPKIAD